MSGGQITDIRRAGNRYRISIDSQAEPLVIPSELYARYQLREGTKITSAQLARLRRESDLIECDNTVARFLGIRPHSEYEIRVKLTKKSFSAQIRNEVIRKYRKSGLLDDANFAAGAVRQILERNPAGRSFLVAGLLKKGIERTLAERTVDTLIDETDELSLALRSLRRQWPKLRQFEVERARKKAYTYLSGRGINYDTARKAFESLLAEMQEDNED